MGFVVTVFGSAFPKEGSEEYTAAYELGKLLAQSGCTVCNGGYGGTMEASARGAKEVGGRTIGVVTEFFSTEANKFIDQKIVVKSIVDRLMRLIELGEAYIVLRGGTGTLVELATVWEYMNKGALREKPIIVVGNHWSKVIDTLNEELVWEGKGNAVHYVTVVRSPRECVEVLRTKLQPP